MESVSDRIRKANTLLAPYAVPHDGVLGRSAPEPDDETRFPFQRDRDRIIHTQAFRRLKGKTQVFVTGDGSTELTTGGDHYRTRLTHTVEVAQISRDMARTLSLNEDLAEAIALAHDLGHPPFGHAGEDALHSWMQAHGSTFEHNTQSLRIVALLEEHSRLRKGLNLNREILEGLQKHRTPHDRGMEGNEGMKKIEVERSPSLEAQIVNVADEVAYTGHDIEDGLKARLFSLENILGIPLARRAEEHARPRGTTVRGAVIHLLVMDLYSEAEQRLKKTGIRTLDDVYACNDPCIGFSRSMESDLTALRAFLWDHMYQHAAVIEANQHGKEIVTRLCDQLLNTPNAKVTGLRRITDSALPEAVKDYVAGMTDRYAEEMLKGRTWVITHE